MAHRLQTMSLLQFKMTASGFRSVGYEGAVVGVAKLWVVPGGCKFTHCDITMGHKSNTS